MKQPRRRMALVATLLMVLSLVCSPREGNARLVEPQRLPGDPPEPTMNTEPDVPPHGVPLDVRRLQVAAALAAQTMRLDPLIAFITINAVTGGPTAQRNSTWSLRR